MSKVTLVCPECNLLFRAENGKPCPRCGFDFQPMRIEETASTPSEEAPPAKKQKQVAEIQTDPMALLLQAQNRTTHAVRSLALFFFTWLRTLIFGGGLSAVGQGLFSGAFFSTSNSEGMMWFGLALMVLGGLVIFVGFFVALNRGLTELHLSRLPNEAGY